MFVVFFVGGLYVFNACFLLACWNKGKKQKKHFAVWHVGWPGLGPRLGRQTTFWFVASLRVRGLKKLWQSWVHSFMHQRHRKFQTGLNQKGMDSEQSPFESHESCWCGLHSLLIHLTGLEQLHDYGNRHHSFGCSNWNRYLERPSAQFWHRTIGTGPVIVQQPR